VSEIVERLEFANRLGLQYGGSRDVYTAAGYPKTIRFNDYLALYERDPLAGRVIDMPAAACWVEHPIVTDDPDPEISTTFDRALQELSARVRLWDWLDRVDRVTGVGRYGVLVFGLAGQRPEQEATRVRTPRGLAYLSALHEGDAAITALDGDITRETFGLPVSYDVKLDPGLVSQSGAGRSTATARLHASRAIHVAEEVTSGRVFGRPRLQRTFNAFQDLLKLTAAAGEMWWRGAYQGLHANVPAEHAPTILSDSKQMEGLKEQIALYTHGWQRWLTTAGVDVTALSPSVSDPRGVFEVIVGVISGATGIPKRILLGSERGELASSQDERAWAQRVEERRTSHCEPIIIRPTIDRMIALGILPEPAGGEYQIEWPSLTDPIAVQRAETAQRVASAVGAYANAEMMGRPVMSRAEFRETVLGLDPEEEEPPGEPPPPPPDEPDEDGGEGAPAASVRTARSEQDRLIDRVLAALRPDRLLDRFIPAARGVIGRFFRRIGRRLGLDLPETTPEGDAWLREQLGKSLASVNDETRKQLADTLADAAAAGETRVEMEQRVRDLFADMSETRAARIARTEATPAANFGKMQAFRRAGARTKWWLSQRDERVRLDHVDADGQVRPLGEPFVVGGELAMFPGDPNLSPGNRINCRCTVEMGAPAGAASIDDEIEQRNVEMWVAFDADVRAEERVLAEAARAGFDDQLADVLEVLLDESRRS